MSQTICNSNRIKFEGLNKRFFSTRDRSFKLHITQETFFITWDNERFTPELDKLRQADFKLDNLVTNEPYKGHVYLKPINKAFSQAEPFFKNDSIQKYVQKFPQLLKTNKNGVTFLSGNHLIKETIIFPKKVPVTIAKGTTLKMDPNVSLLFRGPLSINGTEKNPVIVKSSEEKKSFGTFSVLGHDAIIDHLVISNGNEAYLEGVHFIGQFNVYHGNLTLTNSHISNSASDDGLNVKYGKVFIHHNKFINNSFDALDLDFCTGEVNGNIFKNKNTPDGDGIDLSGSNILIKENSISQFGDKGISIGERATPTLFNNVIYNNKIGIAIKDLSQAKIYSSTIAHNEIGLALYQKKPTFGGGEVEIVNSILLNSKDISLDKKSKVKTHHSTSTTEKKYGFKKIKPNFRDKAPIKLALSENNNSYLLTGADINFIKEFMTLSRSNYPLGSISYLH